ncbi:MAG TPA: DUF5591 domain-containing protein [Candidatus Hodarchaeales archaeon]|nr:DUF5591 domain-containing protein [Candidatus Hodarchaeales archaeon]
MQNGPPIKYELKKHDGPGRLVQYTRIRDSARFIGPLLLELTNIPAVHLSARSGNQMPPPAKPGTEKNTLFLGHLPDLPSFSGVKTGTDLLQLFRSGYAEYIGANGIDIVAFPVDKATKFRQIIQYPSFVQGVIAELPEVFWASPLAEDDSLDQWRQRPQVFVLGDLSFLWDFPRSIWGYLHKVKTFAPDALLYVPAVPPLYVPTLAYLGVDLFDTIYASYMARQNIYATWWGDLRNESKAFGDALPCECIGCRASAIPLDQQNLLEHNLAFMTQMIHATKSAISNSNLRSLVKQTSKSSPAIAGVLRWADMDEHFLPKFVNIDQAEQLLVTDGTDYIRPEIRDYKRRLASLTLYDQIYGVLVFPCSAKKPYSQSESHRKFTAVVKEVLKGSRFGFDEWMITSPMGVVPRSIEETYPAGFYDITVTGHWTEEEYRILHDLMAVLLDKVSGMLPVIVHLPENERELVRRISLDLGREFVFSSFSGSATSQPALQALRDVLISQVSLHSEWLPVPKQLWLSRRFRAIAEYQYGSEVGRALFPDGTKFLLRSMMEVAEDNREQLAALSRDSGLLSLTLEGARRISSAIEGHRVVFDGTIISGSALYCTGIADASTDILPGDDVFVVNRAGEFLGFGKTQLTGMELRTLKHGIGVTMKKKVKTGS